MNHERMLAVADAVEADAGRHFNMRAWMDEKNNPGPLSSIEWDKMRRIIEQRKFDCGTTGCWAGWTAMMFGEPGDFDRIEGAATRLLDLTEDEAHHLFHFSGDRAGRRALEDTPFGEVVAEARRMVEASLAGRNTIHGQEDDDEDY